MEPISITTRRVKVKSAYQFAQELTQVAEELRALGKQIQRADELAAEAVLVWGSHSSREPIAHLYADCQSLFYSRVPSLDVRWQGPGTDGWLGAWEAWGVAGVERCRHCVRRSGG